MQKYKAKRGCVGSGRHILLMFRKCKPNNFKNSYRYPANFAIWFTIQFWHYVLFRLAYGLLKCTQQTDQRSLFLLFCCYFISICFGTFPKSSVKTCKQDETKAKIWMVQN